MLLEAAKLLASTVDLDALSDRLLSISRELMGCEACSFSLVDKGGEGLVIQSTQSELKGDKVLIPKGRGIAWKVFETGQSVLAVDAAENPLHDQSVGLQTGLVAKSIITIPLKCDETVLGVMQAINPLNKETFSEADIEVFEAFGGFVAVTLVRLEEQNRKLEYERTQTQNTLARKVCESFQPPAFAFSGGLTTKAFWRPGDTVGGDFYFFERITLHKSLCGVGDLTGKGFAAALDMARVSALVRTFAADLASGLSLKTWLEMLNNRVHSMVSNSRSCALALALIDGRSSNAEVCCCGQVPPHVHHGTLWGKAPPLRNPPLGLRKDLEMKTAEVPFGEKACLLFVTDGITERQQSGAGNFEKVFEETLATASADTQAVDAISSAWEKSGTNDSETDDATILFVQNTVPHGMQSALFACSPPGISSAREFIKTATADGGFSAREMDRLLLGFDEILSNLFLHAFHKEPHEIRLTLAFDQSLHIQIEHEGIPASPAPRPAAGVNSPHGRGLKVIREVFDEFWTEGHRPPWTVHAVKKINSL